MSAGAVQSFLNQRVPTCLTGYTCLKDYRQDTPYRAGESGRCGAYSGAANESAATIITKVGQACGVSQKALIVLLEKEQGLVSDTWPTSRQYRSATGYGCPDTADCDTAYYGFFNQVWMAALQFKRYAANPTRWNHIAGQNNAIRYSPNSACGSSTVYISNQATAGLYNYTPYQPNAAALQNLYGTGDGCSAYGNRNFWRIYSDWFGSPTIGPAYYIERTYASMGGAAGILGPATTDIRRFEANGGGAVRGYTNGAIAWSAPRGAFAIMGQIRNTYSAWGGVEGWIGWPATGATTVGSHGGGTVQGFQNAAIASSAAGTWTVAGPTRSALAAAGGIDGELGWPTNEDRCQTTGVCSQPFQGGIIYRNSGNAYAVPSVIGDVYSAMGGPLGSLGHPIGTAGSILANGSGGRVQAFVNGAIVVSDVGGAHSITGEIRRLFNAAGGISGPPGWPLGDATCSGDSCSQVFQGGTVYLLGSSGWFIDGRIAGAYQQAGGVSGSLGRPVTNANSVSSNGGGLVQAFTNGAIAWSASGGAHVVSGEVRGYFNSIGGIAGSPGWPTGDMTCSAGTCIQSFTGGTILWSGGRGALVALAVSDRYLASGGMGSLGWPTTGGLYIAANGGGTVQGFENGAIAASTHGSFALSGELRAYYNSLGGVSGALGWPVSEMSCDSASSCSQRFQGGTLTWSPTSGGQRG